MVTKRKLWWLLESSLRLRKATKLLLKDVVPPYGDDHDNPRNYRNLRNPVSPRPFAGKSVPQEKSQAVFR